MSPTDSGFEYKRKSFFDNDGKESSVTYRRDKGLLMVRWKPIESTADEGEKSNTGGVQSSGEASVSAGITSLLSKSKDPTFFLKSYSRKADDWNDSVDYYRSYPSGDWTPVGPDNENDRDCSLACYKQKAIGYPVANIVNPHTMIRDNPELYSKWKLTPD
ncbi:uncharacterized protein I303_100538 [Kwoniella dejecticola CBS 10117]|uniref:Uncharacterized protein n=1 Tax=Kwoniella dejecticola CBS 10117 TaxID=1296121 RepID=A0A1A6AF70_9TREE|nr:uncharacterized protein I303_00539 [Kwoniella dejecticola CBS 10117]OBR88722.1 hypothetical protein I303_00539 [Kwoniella dejecticola CBS 10117]